MASQVGVWIDHREAIVVKVTDKGTETVHIDSEFESQPRRSSDHTSGRFEPLQVQSDDTRERRKNADLNHFYDEVISHFDHAESLYIIGPGEARTELRKRLESRHPTAKKCVIEATDKLTLPQIVAQVSSHFKC